MPSRNGVVLAIFISPAAGEPMQEVSEVEAIAGCGLRGDRYARGEGSYNKLIGVGNRQVTLINARFFRNTGFEYIDSRRNIVVQGADLYWLIEREYKIGTALFSGVKYCDPCKRPSNLNKKKLGGLAPFEEVFEDGGGIISKVVQSGIIRVGDLLIPPSKGY